MSQSLSQILLHIVFSTKSRRPSLSPAIQAELYSYTAAVLRNLECPAVEIGGTTDHIHILCSMSRTLSVAELVENLKRPVSKWLKSKDMNGGKFQWQSGYAAFSVSPSLSPRLVKYILAQGTHHERVSFQDEFRKLLERHNVSYDEKYVWD